MLFRAFKKTCLFCCGLICAAFLFEAVLRCIELTPAWKTLPVAEVSLYGPDAKTAYTHRKNVKGIWTTENRAKISTNEFAIRSNGRHNFTKNPDAKNIGIIGNSIIEALQVADIDTFVSQTEEILRSRINSINVHNLGLSGTTPVIELERSKYFTELLDLDTLIIINSPANLTHRIEYSQGGSLPFYTMDEIGNIRINRKYLKSRGYKIRTSIIGDAFYFLMNHSKLFTVLNNRMNRGLLDELQINKVQQTAHSSENTNTCPNEAIESLKILSQTQDNNSQRTHALINHLLGQYSALQNRTGVKIIYAFYDNWKSCPKTLTQSAHTALIAMLENNNIEYYDLKSDLKSHLPPNITLQDLRGFASPKGHLNYTGHQVFSSTLSNYIINNYSNE
ncbi:MAG: hypothetical protein CL570_07625 [Alphaproteobacteria bacterium]|nr:hypothetical protein [Alphaproteobacteria bacterium]|tara:strand:- start:7900 stop:9075 length:1176 start_codon:yes stop_codon:yes gene_type:complete